MLKTSQRDKARKHLDAYIKNYRKEDMYLSLLRYAMGIATEADVMAKTRHRCDQIIALFFIGYDFYAKGDSQKASQYFQKALDTKVYAFYTYPAARTMLEKCGTREISRDGQG